MGWPPLSARTPCPQKASRWGRSPRRQRRRAPGTRGIYRGAARRAFLSKRRVGAGDESWPSDDLEACLRAMTEQGRSAWHSLGVPPELFAAYVAERLPPGQDTDVAGALRALHAADLYLACACAHGLPGAVKAADTAYLT